jgi:hypothetical protein
MGDDFDWNDAASTANRLAVGERPTPPRELLELDHIYEALSHSRRRYLCYTLLEDTEWSLIELATKIAAWENDLPEHAVTDRLKERVYVSLYHSHVPTLVDQGVITYDDVTETIRSAENAEQVLAALAGMGERLCLDTGQEGHARGKVDDEK